MMENHQHLMALNGRHILVTGASSGIGQAVAVLLSRLGASVACVGRSSGKLGETIRLLAGAGHTTHIFDLNDTDRITSWLIEVAAQTGKLHGLVHAAGLQSVTSLKMFRVEHWREMWRVNTEAALVLAQGFRQRPVYVGENGSIVFISSVMGEVGAPGRAAYSLSKGTLHGFTRSLALELASQHIRVNCVAPAFVRTPMFDEMTRVWTAQQRTEVESAHPLGLGEPEDVANAVAFLLADSGRWITGTVLVVDGGYTAR